MTSSRSLRKNCRNLIIVAVFLYSLILHQMTTLHMIENITYICWECSNYLLRSTAISLAAFKSVHPTRGDFNALLDIVKYIWQTKDIGLIIHPGEKHKPLRLKCFVDASFLTHDDSRGHTGYCIGLGDIGTILLEVLQTAARCNVVDSCRSLGPLPIGCGPHLYHQFM